MQTRALSPGLYASQTCDLTTLPTVPLHLELTRCILRKILSFFIATLTGHMGHGHSHLGHAHSHKGQGDNCKSDEHSYVVHSESQGKTHIHKKCIENGHSGGKNSSSIDEPKLEQQLSRIDEAKVGSQDSELTSVVIVNKVTSRENMTDVGGKELDKSEQENPKLRASPESIAHNGSSEYKIMMNAIQANKEAIENCLHIQAGRTILWLQKVLLKIANGHRWD